MSSLDLPAVRGWTDDDHPDVICFKLPAIPTVLARWIELVERSKTGQFRLLISHPFRPRTTGERSQNNCIHGWETWICQVTGNDVDDLHLFVGRRAMRRGYPAKTDERGNIVYSLVDQNPLPKSTALASIEEAQMWLEEIKQLAAEQEIPLPEYDEKGRVVYR